MFGRSIRATRYKDDRVTRSHFMSGKMRKPKGSASGGERKRTFSASDRPEMISSILYFYENAWIDERWMKTAGHAKEEDGRGQTDHWVRDAGKASMYGFTMRSYNAGVSRTMWTCCMEYCTKKEGVV